MSDALQRWRLILGAAATDALGAGGALDPDDAARDASLAWLYDREVDGDGEARDLYDRSGGDGASVLAVPAWISEVHRLFPKETIERIERDAVETYQIQEVVTNPEVLKRLEPNETLLKAVLQTKHLMNPAVLAMARELVGKVVKRLMDVLSKKLVRALSGGRRSKRTRRVSFRNFDARETIRRNLRHWDPASRRLILQTPFFRERSRLAVDPMTIIILVDQSGSMVSSVIHSAVMASCLWSIPGVTTKLVAFDTAVVDLTSDVVDPVELLMKVQLGGGTDIGRAVRYAATLVSAPRKTIVVLVSDFYEGASEGDLVRSVSALVQQGVRFVGLAALDGEANPAFDRALAKRLVDVGATVGCMTPGELANFLGKVLRG